MARAVKTPASLKRGAKTAPPKDGIEVANKKGDVASAKKRFAAAMDDIIKEDAHGVYFQAEDQDIFAERIESPFLGVNINTRGGIPYNAITEIEGPPASFKTTQCLGYVAAAQKKHGTDFLGVWVSTEQGFDSAWARFLGVKIPYTEKEIAKLRAMFPDNSDLVDRLIAHQLTGGRLIVLASGEIERDFDHAKKMLLTGAVTLYVVDSVGAVSAKSEFDGDIGDSQVAINTRLVTKHIRILHSICNRLAAGGYKTAMIIVNQVRVKIGGYNPNPNVIPMDVTSGMGLKHGKVLELKTKPSGFTRDKEGNIYAKNVVIEVAKSKICIPHRTCTVSFIVRADNPLGLPVGPDIASEILSMAQDARLIAYSPSLKAYVFEDEPLHIDGEPAKKENLLEAIRKPELMERIKEVLMTYHAKLEIAGA